MLNNQPKLTLNDGGRWDYESPISERHHKLVGGFCTTCTNPYQANVTGLTLNGGLTCVDANHRLPLAASLCRLMQRWHPLGR